MINESSESPEKDGMVPSMISSPSVLLIVPGRKFQSSKAFDSDGAAALAYCSHSNDDDKQLRSGEDGIVRQDDATPIVR